MSSAFTEEWIEGPKSTQFYTHTYSPPSGQPTRAAIVFVHGFAEHVGRYEAAFPLIAAHGVSVFAYDQRGFGKTALDTSGKKSSKSSWGVTSWKEQMEDIAFFIKMEKTRVGETVPLFLMGHSMGGGEVLGFATVPPKQSAALASLAGIVSCSPLIRQTTPASKIQVWAGSKLASLIPAKLVPAPVNADDLSHDAERNKAYIDDPLIKATGSLRGIADMLGQGAALSDHHHRNWPADLPVLIIHGSEDKVTDHKASEKFYNDIRAKDKHITIYPGGYHELAQEPEFKNQMTEEISAWVLKRATDAEPKL